MFAPLGASFHQEPVISAKVFVGNLNYSTTKEDLVKALSECGEIVDAFLPTDRESGRPRGFAFVTFSSEDQAKACIERFNGFEIAGRRLNINAAEERSRGGPRGGGGGRSYGGGGGGGGGGPPRGRGGPSVEFRGRRDSAPAPPEPPADWSEMGGGDWRAGDDPGEGGGGGGGDYGGGGGDGGDGEFKKRKRSKGSRRGLRGKKRSL